MTGSRFRKTIIMSAAAGAVAALPWVVRADDAKSTKAANKEKTVKVLVEQGNAALEVKSFESARDTFSDALSLDPKNTDALVGEALARMELDQPIPAIEMIDKVAGSGVPARTVAINAAVVHINGKDPTRAAKILKTYLAAAATPHDEKAYDLFITALSQFSPQAKENYFYKGCQQFAAQYAAKLASDHDGKKLWGVDWVDADEAEKKAAENKEQQTEIDSANARAKAMDNQVNAAQARYDAIEGLYEKGEAYRSAVYPAKNRLEELQDQQKEAQDEADDALSKMDQPPLLKSIDPIMPGQADQVASAAPAPKSTSATDDNSPTPATPPPTPSENPPAQQPTQADPPVVHEDPPKKVAVTNYAVAVAVAPNLAITDARAVHDGNSFSLQSPDGNVVQATLVRTDSSGKLALLQLSKNVPYLDLADSFNGGAITCTGFPEVDIFNPAPAAINGNSPAPADDWQIKLNRHPRLGGAPLTITGGKIVGVELATRDSAVAQIPAISLDAIHGFLGSDQPQPGHGITKPDEAIFQLVSTTDP